MNFGVLLLLFSPVGFCWSLWNSSKESSSFLFTSLKDKSVFEGEIKGSCDVKISTLTKKLEIHRVDFEKDIHNQIFFTNPSQLANKMQNLILKKCSISFIVEEEESKTVLELNAEPLQKSVSEHFASRDETRRRRWAKFRQVLFVFGILLVVFWILTKLYVLWCEYTVGTVKYVNNSLDWICKWLFWPSSV